MVLTMRRGEAIVPNLPGESNASHCNGFVAFNASVGISGLPETESQL